MGKGYFYVVQIYNADQANEESWFKKIGGTLHVVQYDQEDQQFNTVNPIDDKNTTGHIPLEHAMIMNRFEPPYSSDFY